MEKERKAVPPANDANEREYKKHKDWLLDREALGVRHVLMSLWVEFGLWQLFAPDLAGSRAGAAHVLVASPFAGRGGG